MMKGLLHILSWNVVARPLQPKQENISQNLYYLVETQHPHFTLIGTQNIFFWLTTTLCSILLDHHQIIAMPEQGRGGTTILIHPDFQVIQSKIFHAETLAWAQIEGSLGAFHIASVYGPNNLADIADFWLQLNDNLPPDNWIVVGDFNFTKHAQDLTFQASLLHDTELEEWRALKCRLGLTYLFQLLNGVDGARFTWWWCINGRTIQSCLDKLFISTQGWWVHSFHQLSHLPTQALSDHNPIRLTCLIN